MTNTISVVIPVYNEAPNVTILYGQLLDVVNRLSMQWEFLFIDDGSSDNTWERLSALGASDSRVRAVRLRRNFGQTAAMACGIDLARGEIIITMDGDLQNDPADIPKLVDKLDEGYDMACGWRKERKDKLMSRRIPSSIANTLIGWLTGVRLHDYGCSLRAYRAEGIKKTALYAELHRFIPAMGVLAGMCIAEVPISHHPRRFGKTKYNLWRTWRVILDMITVSILLRFASKPLRFFGMMSLMTAAFGMFCVYRAWHWYIEPHSMIPQVLPGIAVLCIWLAGHLFITGWLGELCLATGHEKPVKSFVVKEV